MEDVFWERATLVMFLCSSLLWPLVDLQASEQTQTARYEPDQIRFTIFNVGMFSADGLQEIGCTGWIPEKIPGFYQAPKNEHDVFYLPDEQFSFEDGRGRLVLWCIGKVPQFLIVQPVEYPTHEPDGSLTNVSVHGVQAVEISNVKTATYVLGFHQGNTTFQIQSSSLSGINNAKAAAQVFVDAIVDFNKTVPDHLIDELKSNDYRQRDKALDFLRENKIDDDRILQQLIQFAQAKNVDAVTALSFYKDDCPTVCPLLIQLVTGENYHHAFNNASWLAGQALVEIGTPAVHYLLDLAALQQPDYHQRILDLLEGIASRHAITGVDHDDMLRFLEAELKLAPDKDTLTQLEWIKKLVNMERR